MALGPAKEGSPVKKRLAVGGLVVLLSGFAVIHAAASGGSATPAAADTTVHTGNLVATVSATGNIVPLQQLTLDFPNPGRLVELDVKLGDPVTKGQVLAKIDDRPAQDEVARTTAAVADATARLAQDSVGLSPAQRVESQALVTQAQAQFEAVRAGLRLVDRMGLAQLANDG